jgi:hypothetical protein
MASCKVTFAPPNNCSLVHRRAEQCSLLYPENNEQYVFGFMIKYAPSNGNQTIVKEQGQQEDSGPPASDFSSLGAVNPWDNFQSAPRHCNKEPKAKSAGSS